MTTMSGIHNSNHCTADHGQPCGECVREQAKERYEHCNVSVTGQHRIDAPFCKDCGLVVPAPKPFPLLSPPLRSLGEVAADTVNNRPLIPSRRQLFEPPLSDACDFRSLPLLLRAVAAWMEANNVEDPEFDGLTIERVFPTVGEDECRYTAVLYWHKESDGPTNTNDAAELLELDAEEVRRLLEERMR